MGKLNGMQSQLKALKALTDKQRIAQTFGVDLESLEPPVVDPVDARERETSEALCKAIGSLGECMEEAAEAQCKAITEAVTVIPEGLASDAGIAKALKAHATVVKTALGNRDDSAVVALMERLVVLFEENQRLLALLIEEKEEPEEEPETVRFDIERDRNGFMTSVIARH